MRMPQWYRGMQIFEDLLVVLLPNCCDFGHHTSEAYKIGGWTTIIYSHWLVDGLRPQDAPISSEVVIRLHRSLFCVCKWCSFEVSVLSIELPPDIWLYQNWQDACLSFYE